MGVCERELKEEEEEKKKEMKQEKKEKEKKKNLVGVWERELESREGENSIQGPVRCRRL